MGRKSTRKNKNRYFALRERMGLSREQASERSGITVNRLSRIEYGETIPYPEEILALEEAYRVPDLSNYYCAADCPLGRKYVPLVEVKDLPVVTLELLALLNRLTRQKDRLIEITVDGRISEDEIADFQTICSDLEKMSLTIDSMQSWIKTKIAEGAIQKRSEEAD